ncbi:MAG: hypothetical protein IPG71_09325 [bacterium]|nr:hypothetical protein [bacterium]
MRLLGREVLPAPIKKHWQLTVSRHTYNRLLTFKSVEEYQVWIFFDTPLQVDRVVRTIRGLISQSRLEEHIPSVPGGLELMTGESQYVFLPYFGESTSSSLVDQDGNLFTDANVFVDNVKRASVSEFESLERAISPLVHSMQDDRANHMGTPAGFQKVKDNCPFVKWCEDNATIGISEPLITALITNLCRFGKESFAFLVEIAKKGPENFNIVEYKDRVASMIGSMHLRHTQQSRGLGGPGSCPNGPIRPQDGESTLTSTA